MKGCGQFSPTMQNFATVTTNFSQALVAAESGNENRESGQGHMQKDVSSSENGTSPDSDGSGLSISRVSQAGTTSPNISLLDPLSAEWEVRDMFWPLDWNGISNETIQR